MAIHNFIRFRIISGLYYVTLRFSALLVPMSSLISFHSNSKQRSYLLICCDLYAIHAQAYSQYISRTYIDARRLHNNPWWLREQATFYIGISSIPSFQPWFFKCFIRVLAFWKSLLTEIRGGGGVLHMINYGYNLPSVQYRKVWRL